jgi:hypothetical protein
MVLSIPDGFPCTRRSPSKAHLLINCKSLSLKQYFPAASIPEGRVNSTLGPCETGSGVTSLDRLRKPAERHTEYAAEEPRPAANGN